MPTMNTSAFAPLPEVVLPGKPAYLYGSLATDTQDTLLQVTNVAATGGTATVSVYVRAGNIPVVGNLISIAGTQTSSGLFNVSSAPLTNVTINATTGIGTVQFALVGTVGSVADSGQALVPIQ